jgi:hypothetical protein
MVGCLTVGNAPLVASNDSKSQLANTGVKKKNMAGCLKVGNDPLIAGNVRVRLLGVLLQQQQRLLVQVPRVVEDD